MNRLALFIIFSLFASLSFLLPLSSVVAAPPVTEGQPQTKALVTIDFDRVRPVPPEWRLPIIGAMEEAPDLLASEKSYTISAFREYDNWMYAIAVPVRIVEARWEVELRSEDIIELLGRRIEDGRLEFAVAGTESYSNLANTVPSAFGNFTSAVFTDSSPEAITYQFPWPQDQPWYKTQGWHGGNGLDFQPVRRETPSIHLLVTAAAYGYLREICDDGHQSTLELRHRDGNTDYTTKYLHLNRHTIERNALLNRDISRGQLMAELYNGNQGQGYSGGNWYQYNTACGRGEAAHLHFVAPNQSITINGYQISTVASSAFATQYVSSNPLLCLPSKYRAEYYNNKTLSGTPIFRRCEGWPINHNWSGGGPGNGIGNDNFSVRWTGRTSFPSGVHNFRVVADDGVRVYVDNTAIISRWRDQGATEYSSNLNMSAGDHSVKVEYYENGGAAVAQFRWSQLVPGVILYGGFEGGPYNPWTESSARGYLNVTQGNTYQGNWKAWLGGSNSEDGSVSQTITVPGNGATLYYRYSISSAETLCVYDYGYVQVNQNTVKTHRLCSWNNTSGYSSASVSLNAYAGQIVQIRFRARTDGSLVSSFLVDNVGFSSSRVLEIQNAEPPQALVEPTETKPVLTQTSDELEKGTSLQILFEERDDVIIDEVKDSLEPPLAVSPVEVTSLHQDHPAEQPTIVTLSQIGLAHFNPWQAVFTLLVLVGLNVSLWRKLRE